MDKIHRKQELYTNDLTNIITEYNSCETVLNEIENEQGIIVNKYRKILTIIALSCYFILVFLNVISCLGIFAFDIITLIKVSLSITDVNTHWGVFGLAVGIVGVELYIGKKLYKFLENKVDALILKIAGFLIKKCESSKQYKELEFLRKVASEMLEQDELEKSKTEAEKNSLDLEYTILKKEYDYKKGIVEYLDKQINPTEMTTCLNRVLSE